MKTWFVWSIPSKGYWTGDSWSDVREDAMLFPSRESACLADLREGVIVQVRLVDGGSFVLI